MKIAAHDNIGISWGTFRKSRFSDSGNCVEVAFMEPGDVLVRDSKNPHDAVLAFTAGEWSAFLLGVNAGEFNPPGRH